MYTNQEFFYCIVHFILVALIVLLSVSTDIVVSLNVSFSQSTYSINEDVGVVQPVLVLSNISSTIITLQVRDSGNNAIGE